MGDDVGFTAQRGEVAREAQSIQHDFIGHVLLFCELKEIQRRRARCPSPRARRSCGDAEGATCRLDQNAQRGSKITLVELKIEQAAVAQFALGAQFSVLKDAAIFYLCGAGGGERLVCARDRRA